MPVLDDRTRHLDVRSGVPVISSFVQREPFSLPSLGLGDKWLDGLRRTALSGRDPELFMVSQAASKWLTCVSNLLERELRETQQHFSVKMYSSTEDISRRQQEKHQ